MFHLTERMKLTALATLALLASPLCVGCSAAMVWKVDADQQTTGDIKVDIEPKAIPGITPAPPPGDVTAATPPHRPTLTAASNLYADARFNWQPNLKPARTTTR